MGLYYFANYRIIYCLFSKRGKKALHASMRRCPVPLKREVYPMTRLSIETPSSAEVVLRGLYRDIERRISASSPGLCPIDMSLSFLRLCHAQTCGKCVPCRIGLGQLATLIESVMNRTATLETIDRIERTAKVIADSADCAIGYEAAVMVLKGVKGFRDDYEEHILRGRCITGLTHPVPCVSVCPAHVDVPGYIALIREKRYDEAVALIRKDNPFPGVCGYVCEHPCEIHCRRRMVDDAVNICGLKRFAIDHSKPAAPPKSAKPTGRTVAIIGGGPGGLTAAYYLSLMGHSCTIFEQRPQLGGMLRYGIPDYRLPPEILDRDISHILWTGIDVHTGISIGKDVGIENIQKDYDAVYIAIGAHSDKKLRIEGEDAKNVISAVSMLRGIGENIIPDFTDKRICVIGGGNVSMDATRTAKRLGAASVICLYRRRVEDMTALPEEISAAMAEGCEIRPLEAPDHIEKDGDGKVAALWTRPQIIGKYGHDAGPVRETRRRTSRAFPATTSSLPLVSPSSQNPLNKLAWQQITVPSRPNGQAPYQASIISLPAATLFLDRLRSSEPLPREKSRQPISTHFSALTTRFRSISRFRRPTLQTRRPADASISSITEDLTVPVTSACL